MTELSQPETGIWRERLWFVARLFAAWAVLVMIGDFVLLAFSPLASDDMTKVDQVPNLWATIAVQAAGAGWIYFLSSYFVAGFFRESAIMFGVGVFAIGMIYNSLYGFIEILVTPYVAERMSPGILIQTPWEYVTFYISEGPFGHDLAYTAIVLIFATAGATMRHFSPPARIAAILTVMRGRN